MDQKATQEKLYFTILKSKIVTPNSFDIKFWAVFTQDLGIYNYYKQEDPISIVDTYLTSMIVF